MTANAKHIPTEDEWDQGIQEADVAEWERQQKEGPQICPTCGEWALEPVSKEQSACRACGWSTVTLA